jgi:hypothetical protein
VLVSVQRADWGRWPLVRERSTTDTFDTELDGRLAALEDRAPAGAMPSLPARRRGHRGPLGLSVTLAAVLTLGAVVTATAGAVVVMQVVGQAPGVENEGQPLHGANLECMTPPDAAAYLAARGYTGVVWQVEGGDGTKGGGTSVQQSSPPTHGFVVPGSLLNDGRLHMVIDQRVGAQGVGACFGMPTGAGPWQPPRRRGRGPGRLPPGARGVGPL